MFHVALTHACLLPRHRRAGEIKIGGGGGGADRLDFPDFLHFARLIEICQTSIFRGGGGSCLPPHTLMCLGLSPCWLNE